ncbi:elongin-B-like [Lynx canadensis]|nr:elongin-B-like [Lynx canadensis]
MEAMAGACAALLNRKLVAAYTGCTREKSGVPSSSCRVRTTDQPLGGYLHRGHVRDTGQGRVSLCPVGLSAVVAARAKTSSAKVSKSKRKPHLVGRPAEGVLSIAAQARTWQDVFLMIRPHKTTIFAYAKESSTLFELKRIVEGIFKWPPDEQPLYKNDQLLDDGKTLGECGFTSQMARPQAPATLGLAFQADEAFQALHIEPFSSPPELPDVMKPQDSGSSANEQAVQ